MSESSSSVSLQQASVFISYSRGDGREFAHALRQKLEAEGFSIWQDVVSETAGEGWWQNIVEAIEGSAVMLLIFTEGALRSQVCATSGCTRAKSVRRSCLLCRNMAC